MPLADNTVISSTSSVPAYRTTVFTGAMRWKLIGWMIRFWLRARPEVLIFATESTPALEPVCPSAQWMSG